MKTSAPPRNTHRNHPNRLAAPLGNTLTEYTVIAVLVLIVVFGGLSVVGKRLTEYMGGLKNDMAHHQQLATNRVRTIDSSLMPVGKTRTITLSNGQVVTLTYGKNTINVSGANGDSYDIPLDRSKADPTLLLSDGKLALQYGQDMATTSNSSPGSNATHSHDKSNTEDATVSGVQGSHPSTPSTSNKPVQNTSKDKNPPKKDTKPKKKNKQHSNNGGNKGTITEPPPEVAQPTTKERPPWCSSVTSGKCMESTGKPGIARIVVKTTKGGSSSPTDNTTSSGSKQPPWCSQVTSGPCKMNVGKAKQDGISTESVPKSGKKAKASTTPSP